MIFKLSPFSQFRQIAKVHKGNQAISEVYNDFILAECFVQGKPRATWQSTLFNFYIFWVKHVKLVFFFLTYHTLLFRKLNILAYVLEQCACTKSYTQ